MLERLLALLLALPFLLLAIAAWRLRHVPERTPRDYARDRLRLPLDRPTDHSAR